MPGLHDFLKEFREAANPCTADTYRRFFKCGPGEYGEHLRLLGLRVPQVRAFVPRLVNLSFAESLKLLHSEWHEERMLGLLLWICWYERGGAAERECIFNAYIRYARQVNNWDLVDLSADKIAGRHLAHRAKSPLEKLIRSPDMWERRIAVVATLWMIRLGKTSLTFRLCRRVLRDPEDLMHKAAGWMLREAGKKHPSELRQWLGCNYSRMPRTMLRYAIEKFPARERRQWLEKT